jgi:putative ABC transport system permease protein
MMNKMVVANLVHRPTRSFIAMSAIALEVTMILMVVALFYGLLNGSKDSQMGVGADLLVMPPGAASVIGLEGLPISVKVGDKLTQIPHVQSVVPVGWWFTPKPIEILWGVDLKTFDRLPPKWTYLSGGPFQGPYDVVVDDYYAKGSQKKVGDVIPILGHDFRISGIVPHGKGCRKCLPLETMQDLLSADGKTSVFYLKLDNVSNSDAVEKAIEAVPGMEKYSVRSMPDFLSTMTPDNLPGFDLAIKVVIGVAVVVGFLVIFQSMYTAVMERTREIGILKSLGASKWYIVNVVLRETVLLAIAGIVVGIILSFVTRRVIMFEKPVLRLFWSNDWVLRAAVIAVVGALAGALYPAWKAARRDPIEALAYE